jgi:hypothetical protein
MTEAKFAIVALTAALLVPQGVNAQFAPRVEAGALVTQQDGGLPMNMFRLAPALRYENGPLVMSARGSAWLSDQQQWQLADGGVSGMFTSPTVYGVRAEMISNASRAFSDQSLGDDQIDVQTRIHVLFKQRGGLWVGGGVARPWRVAVVSSVDVAGGGVWTRLGNAMLSGTVTNFSFTKVAPALDSSNTAVSCGGSTAALLPVGFAPVYSISGTTPTTCSRQSRFSDAEASVHWEHGLLELNAQAGYRIGGSYDVTPDSRRWSSATATMWMNDRVALVAGGGRQPANVARGIPSRRYATLGMTLAAWPMPKGVVPVATPKALLVKSFEMRSAAPGMQKIIVRVGGVETVDVMGDFSDWSPLTLVRHGRDLWELSVPLSPGQHQINVRVDGGLWVAPPGVPTMRDGFNGEVGILVVPADKEK